MPNWCTNELVITGALEDRERFAEAVLAFPDDEEKEHLLAEQRRRDERPFIMGGWFRESELKKALAELPEEERADAEIALRHANEVSDAAAHVEAASVITGVSHPTPEDYARACEERPHNGLMSPDDIAAAGTWEEILAEVDARRARGDEYRRKEQEKIGLEFFDEDGFQARWLSFAALVPLDGGGSSTAQVMGQADAWGTKWEPDDDTVREMTDEALIYRFDTAWTPPVAWLTTVARWYPELTFRLAAEEVDSDIARVVVVEGGEVTVDDSELDSSGGWYAGAAELFARHGCEGMAETMRDRAAEEEDGE